MLRTTQLSRLFSNSHFYHPCNFKITPQSQALKVCALQKYIETYRIYAHYYAKLDPLDLYNKSYQEFVRPTDLGIQFNDSPASYSPNDSPLVSLSKTIQELEIWLKKVYQTHTAVEFTHLSLLEEKQWLYSTYQTLMTETLPSDLKIKLTKIIVQAEALDHFLHKKFVTFKRYSGQGAQSTVLALEVLFEMGAKEGFSDIVFGMPHRGRLNTLVNVLNYPASHLFRRISGKLDTPQDLHTVIDDAVSHIAQSVVKSYDGKQTKVTLVHNPSHLQAQNPVSMGKTRSKQVYSGRDSVLNIQVHGDAALSAQGIVYETLCLSKVPKFEIGGTIHLVTNNQIGYTTRPIDSRSSKYSCDIAKAFDIPIIHVNSQNIEDVYRVMKLCMNFKKKFNKDILVDLICYRKYGHNEVDQPEFTQPKMYQKIRKNFNPNPKRCSQELQDAGLVHNFYDSTRDKLFKQWQQEFQTSKQVTQVTLKDYLNPQRKGSKAFTHLWANLKPSLLGNEQPTGFDTQMLKEFLKASVFYPPDFSIHSRIKKFHIDQRIKSLDSNNLNWATCEALALFSLNYQGYNIRFTGQDVERGTFSQRHLNLVDQNTQIAFNPLEFFSQQQPGRGRIQLYNSPLTENAAMSYEYGYSLDNPNNFVVWQAQFGDFFNTAQVVIDVFLTNSENKWMRQNGLVLILPHGFDGAGPQHSSCRIQRFLQLANTDGGIIYNQYQEYEKGRKLRPLSEQAFSENIQQANFSLVIPSKPANMFHALRRQMKRDFRKPLVIAGPKTRKSSYIVVLRLPGCTSSIQDMGPNSQFKRIISYTNAQTISSSEIILLCSGRVVYDVQTILKDKKSTKTSLITVEELFPFPESEITQLLSKCKQDTQIYWVQQQNLNGGAFSFAYPRLLRIARNLNLVKEVRYIGRKSVAATAVGNSQLHQKQAKELADWIRSAVV